MPAGAEHHGDVGAATESARGPCAQSEEFKHLGQLGWERTDGECGPLLAPSAPRAFVIHENFNPVLACKTHTSVDTQGCGEHRVLAADALLEGDARAIFDLLGIGARHNFVAAETTWLAYRNADCQSQADIYESSTERKVGYVDCLAADDNARRQNLDVFFRSFVQDYFTKRHKAP